MGHARAIVVLSTSSTSVVRVRSGSGRLWSGKRSSSTCSSCRGRNQSLVLPVSLPGALAGCDRLGSQHLSGDVSTHTYT